MSPSTPPYHETTIPPTTITSPSIPGRGTSPTNRRKRTAEAFGEDTGDHNVDAINMHGTLEDEYKPALKVAKTKANKDGKTRIQKKDRMPLPRVEPWGGAELDKHIKAEQRFFAAKSNQPGNLVKFLRKSSAFEKPMHFKSNAVGTQKVSIMPKGSGFPILAKPYQKREILEDVKNVDKVLALEKHPMKPTLELKTTTKETNSNVEILSLPPSMKIIRVTNKMKGAGGETASLDDIRKKPTWFPHIKIMVEKDSRGCTVAHREKIEPERLEDLRNEHMKREKASKKATRGHGRKNTAQLEYLPKKKRGVAKCSE
ncbi:hypothetical protein P280DRAFT_516759 [Massarina eburnea CBS 473.64]|uniref:Uncharacterized protein n=1 Tax=Massarina eburnea CBS 473.64 TaxID=1395130 RepID=A0A6A6S1P6_9PLEO|nr:hypothetical protein P280DRAFT_516759 [Massarina eburnea CBS 473.64]